jgi:3-hydroxyisobutyrate dehydrogenase-like beta-hydroxyacid dehydrogenase
MSSVTIGIFSPGAMGSALGRSWQLGGARVVTTVAGRSERTRSLADGLELLSSLDDVVEAADVVVSIGPPANAVTMATEIAAACKARQRRPLVADLNAVAPSTVNRIAAVLDSAGCEVLDGSISGGPPRPTTTTRLYLSGSAADVLADLGSPGLIPTIVGTKAGTASAVKMSTAAMYKGFVALLLQSLQTAHANGVIDLVLDDLRSEFGELLDHAATSIAMAASKADRYSGEMLEISAAQGAAGAEPELYQAMAHVYEAVGRTELAALSPEQARQLTDLETVLRLLATTAGSGSPSPAR